MTVTALQRGEPEVLADLLAQHGHEIQAVAYLILRDRAEAEDVVSDTLLRALRSGRSLRGVETIRPWLLRIATNQAIDRRRRSARIRYVHLVPERTGPAEDSVVIDRTVLLDALERLPTRVRAAVVLRYYADLPVADVATAMGTSVNTVKTQLRTALASLREALGDDGERRGNVEVSHA